jgi:hypothetical protein
MDHCAERRRVKGKAAGALLFSGGMPLILPVGV